MSEGIQEGVRVRVEKLLRLGEVSCVIGHEHGPHGRTRPAFVYDRADVERLVWDQTCHHNLIVYLRDRVSEQDDGGRVAVVARPCDVRTLNVLIHEDQLSREQVFVVGVACPGMVADGSLMVHCQRCTERVPVFYDTLVGEPPEIEAADSTPRADEPRPTLASLERMTAGERLDFWARTFDRCIRCYACRQACPACYCFECVAEQVDPGWVSIAHGRAEKAFFHIMRAYHLAGRCASCNACELACPMDIPLGLLNEKLAQEVRDLFGYVAGGDANAPPPLATFRKDEDLSL
jgi:ferredoxin